MIQVNAQSAALLMPLAPPCSASKNLFVKQKNSAARESARNQRLLAIPMHTRALLNLTVAKHMGSCLTKTYQVISSSRLATNLFPITVSLPRPSVSAAACRPRFVAAAQQLLFWG
jgi:hypothetical protein